MLIQGDARCLPLADQSVQCVVTSPPYFGLRDYGSSAQIGLEPTPAAYVASLVTVFREVWRVLRDDGTVWLNLGDSYNSNAHWSGGGPNAQCGNTQRVLHDERRALAAFKTKDLLGIPWMVAFALRDAGWYLRSDIIWSKPNPMPESVMDRPTKAHEYLFLLSKSERYFYDAEAIMEPVSIGTVERRASSPPCVTGRGLGKDAPTQQRSNSGGYPPRTDRKGDNSPRNDGNEWNSNNGRGFPCDSETRNKRSVWEIPTKPYTGAHFATFPEALVEPCVLAGSRLGDVVLDPFCGSGTVPFVAERLSRKWVGLDLAYQGLAADRTAQRGLQFT